MKPRFKIPLPLKPPIINAMQHHLSKLCCFHPEMLSFIMNPSAKEKSSMKADCRVFVYSECVVCVCVFCFAFGISFAYSFALQSCEMVDYGWEEISADGAVLLLSKEGGYKFRRDVVCARLYFPFAQTPISRRYQICKVFSKHRNPHNGYNERKLGKG